MVRLAFLFLTALVGTTLLIQSVDAIDVSLDTPQGTIVGSTQGPSDDIVAYKGIPYAQAPINDMRFRPPGPIPSFNSTLSGADYKPSCIVPGTNGTLTGSEDCLYANVFAPYPRRNGSLPVYVYIYGQIDDKGIWNIVRSLGRGLTGLLTHSLLWSQLFLLPLSKLSHLSFYPGGGFVSGSAQANPGDNYVRADSKLITVTFNYRVGPLGFFAHPALSNERGNGNVASSGNFGFEDQVALLRWVKANIAAYGGDPNQVTIGGESAGAISVCLHMMSPLSTGLFHRAILQSGGCDFDRTLAQSEAIGVKLANAMEELAATADVCTGRFGEGAQLNCFRTVPPLLIYGAANKIGSFAFFGPTALTPCVDGYVFKDFVPNLIASGNVNKVDIIAGTCAEEMSAFTPPIGSPSQFPPASLEEIQIKAGNLSNGNATIVNYYTNLVTSNKLSAYRAYNALLSTYQFQCPTTRLARAMKDFGKNVYSFVFNYSSPLVASVTSITGGAYHSSDLPYTHGVPIGSTSPTASWSFAADQATSESMRNYWVKFAEYGDVNQNVNLAGIPSTVAAPSWSQWTDAGRDALLFQYDGSLSMFQGQYSSDCELWDQLTLQQTSKSFEGRIVGNSAAMATPSVTLIALMVFAFFATKFGQ